MNTKEMLSTAMSEKLAELRKLPYLSIQQLPKHQRMPIAGIPNGGLQVWVDSEKDESVKVVVQAYKNYFFGLGVSQLGGFLIAKNNVSNTLNGDALE